MKQKDNCYYINLLCRNCGNRSIGEFTKGEEMPMRSVCPHCECVSAFFDSPYHNDLIDNVAVNPLV